MTYLNVLTVVQALLLGGVLGAVGMLLFLTWIVPNDPANKITDRKNAPAEISILGIVLIGLALLTLGRMFVQLMPYMSVAPLTWGLLLAGLLLILVAYAIRRSSR